MNIYTIHVEKSSGVKLTIYDEITLDEYSDGSSVSEYSTITIICEVKSGYKLKTFTVNGMSFDQFASILVTSDVYIIASANSIGAVHINPGQGFSLYKIKIYSNTGWHVYMPCIYDGSYWSIRS